MDTRLVILLFACVVAVYAHEHEGRMHRRPSESKRGKRPEISCECRHRSGSGFPRRRGCNPCRPRRCKRYRIVRLSRGTCRLLRIMVEPNKEFEYQNSQNCRKYRCPRFTPRTLKPKPANSTKAAATTKTTAATTKTTAATTKTTAATTKSTTTTTTTAKSTASTTKATTTKAAIVEQTPSNDQGDELFNDFDDDTMTDEDLVKAVMSQLSDYDEDNENDDGDVDDFNDAFIGDEFFDNKDEVQDEELAEVNNEKIPDEAANDVEDGFQDELREISKSQK